MVALTPEATTEELLIVERPAAGVLWLILNRPDKLNALSKQLLARVADTLREAETDNDVRCVVLAGAGKAFSAGADIGDMTERGLDSYLDAERLAHWRTIEVFPKPIVAAVNGYALGGGCELAMLCDIIVASENARFGQAEINIGVFPGDGGTQRLPRLVGKGFAMKMILGGEIIDAQEAAQRGLVTDLVSATDLRSEVLDLAQRIASKAPIATQLAKKAVLQAFEMPLREGLDFERESITRAFATEDRVEGMRAFIEKRPPQFTGR